MKRLSKMLGWAICALFCTAICARGQPVPGLGKTKEWIDREVERHRWEINVNAGNFFGKGAGWIDGYYSLIKLNSKAKKSKRDGAWRFALSPFAENSKLYLDGDTLIEGGPLVNRYQFAPQFAFGYEWQKIRGRTMFFGGLDLAGQLSRTKHTAYNTTSPWDNNVTGSTVTKLHRNFVWLATFLGAKLYLNHRFSVSLESHIRLMYGVDGTRTWFERKFIARNLQTFKQIDARPSSLINLSYNL